MSKYYKLTDENSQTYGGCQWGEGITHTTDGEGELCNSGWIHFYLSPELAVLLNPIHANFKTPILWEIEAEVEKSDHQLKAGSTRVTTVKKIPLPTCTTEQRVKFGILCTLKVYQEPSFVEWANNWLNGTDRSYAASYVASRAAADAADAADAASYSVASYSVASYSAASYSAASYSAASYSAAYAAYDAAYAASYADVAARAYVVAACAAAYAASYADVAARAYDDAARVVARAAGHAVDAAAYTVYEFNLIGIAKEALK